MLAGDAARFSVRGFWVTSGLPSDPSSICVACTHRSVSQFGEQAIDHEHRVSMSGAIGASQLPLDEVRKSVLGCVGVPNPTPATSMPQVDSHRRALQATLGVARAPRMLAGELGTRAYLQRDSEPVRHPLPAPQPEPETASTPLSGGWQCPGQCLSGNEWTMPVATALILGPRHWRHCQCTH